MFDRDKLHPNETVVKASRRYTSTLREEQARETRLRILEAAQRLFLERGYVATSIEAIAREARVATQTVYAAFGNKRTILAQMMDLAVGGDDEPVALLDREGPQQMRGEPDQRRQVQMVAQGIGKILERAGPIFTMMRVAAASDPEIATLYDRLQAERLRNMNQIVEWLTNNGPLRDGLTTTEAADILWTLTSADVHRLLTAERGWPSDRYVAWLNDTLGAVLLP